MPRNRKRHLGTILWITLAVVGIYLALQWDLYGALAGYWMSLSPEGRDLLGIIILPVLFALGAVISGLLARRQGRWFFERQQKQQLLLSGDLAFPFEVFSSSDLDKLRRRMLGEDAGIPHYPRFPSDRQGVFEESMGVTRYLLLTGRSGLGKTRECVEIIARLAEQKGEEVVILCPLSYMDVPTTTNLPPEVQRARILVLFIDNVNQHYVYRPGAGLGLESRQYHDRLVDTVRWLEETFVSRDLRVIVTHQDEPEPRDVDRRTQPRLDTRFWRKFKQYQLPGIHRSVRPEFVTGMAEHFRLRLNAEAVDFIVNHSDGTCAGIVTALRRESSRRGSSNELTIEHLEGYNFAYPLDWESQVYGKVILPFPDRKAVFNALAILYELHIPAYGYLVADLSARLWRGSLPLLKRARIRKVIRRDLRAWIFTYKGEFICPASYLEGKSRFNETLPGLVKSVRLAIRRRKDVASLVPGLLAAVDRLRDDLGASEAAGTIIEALSTRAGRVSAIWVEVSKHYDKVGNHRRALNAAERAVKFDTANPRAQIALAFALRGVKRFDRALEAAQVATSMAPNDYTVWFYYGVLLSKSHRIPESIVALQRAHQLSPESARVWYSLGISYDRNNESQNAIAACIRATELDPSDPVGWRNLGIAYDRSGEPDLAIDALERSRDLDPDQESTWLSLARLYFSAGREDDGVKAISRVKERTPDDVSVLIAICKVYGKVHRYQDAVEAARRAAEINPNSVEAWRGMAINLGNLKRHDEAIDAQAHALDLAESAEEWFHMSAAYGIAGRFDDAARAARKATVLDPTFIPAWRNLSINLTNAGKRNEAIEAQQKVAKLANTSDAWFNLGVALGKAERYRESISATKRSIEIDPKFTEAWRSLAINYTHLGETDEAIEARKTLVGLKGDAEEWFNLHVACLHASRLEESVVAARKAVELDPARLDAWRGLASALDTLGETGESIEAQRMVALTAANADEWNKLGSSLARAGRFADGLVAADKAIELDPEYSDAWRNRAFNLSRLGRKDEAIASQERAAQLSGSPEDWNFLSVVYGTAERYEDALMAGRAAVAVDPGYAPGWRSVSINLTVLGRAEEAAQARTKLRGLVNTAEDWHDLSVAYGKAALYQEAIEAAINATEMDPSYAPAWRSLSLNHTNAGNIGAAISAQRKHAELVNTADEWYNSSVGYGKAGQYSEAVEAARKALEVDGTHPGAWNSLVRNLRNLGKSHEAIEALKKLENIVRTADQWAQLSATWGKADHYEEAAAAARRAIEIDPGNIPAWRSLAMNLEQLGRVEEAGDAWKRYGELAGVKALDAPDSSGPEAVEAWRTYARSLKMLGRCDEAIGVAAGRLQAAQARADDVLSVIEECLTSATAKAIALLDRLVKAEPGNARGHHLLSVVYRKSGRLDEAVAEGNEAVRLDPRSFIYWYALGRTCEDLSSTRAAVRAQAVRAYQRTLELKPDHPAARDRLRALLDGPPSSATD